MAHATRPEPKRGEVFGAFTVLREATRGPAGVRRFAVRASCCGDVLLKQHSDLRRAAKSCRRCKSNGRGMPSLRMASVQP